MWRGVVIRTVINNFTFDGATKDPMQQALRDALIGFMAAIGARNRIDVAMARERLRRWWRSLRRRGLSAYREESRINRDSALAPVVSSPHHRFHYSRARNPSPAVPPFLLECVIPVTVARVRLGYTSGCSMLLPWHGGSSLTLPRRYGGAFFAPPVTPPCVSRTNAQCSYGEVVCVDAVDARNRDPRTPFIIAEVMISCVMPAR